MLVAPALQNDNAADRPDRISEPAPQPDASSGKLPRSIARCSSTRRRLVLPALTISHAETVNGIPSTLGRHPRSEATLAIESPKQLVHVDEGCLELDHQQCAATRVPREDVDDAALAVDRERDFGRRIHAGSSSRNQRATDS